MVVGIQGPCSGRGELFLDLDPEPLELEEPLHMGGGSLLGTHKYRGCVQLYRQKLAPFLESLFLLEG